MGQTNRYMENLPHETVTTNSYQVSMRRMELSFGIYRSLLCQVPRRHFHLQPRGCNTIYSTTISGSNLWTVGSRHVIITTVGLRIEMEPGWLSMLSTQLLISAQVMISRLLGSNPTSGSVLTAQSLLGILFLSLSLSPLPSPALSLSPQNK